jgi:hypothetical protein
MTMTQDSAGNGHYIAESARILARLAGEFEAVLDSLSRARFIQEDMSARMDRVRAENGRLRTGLQQIAAAGRSPAAGGTADGGLLGSVISIARETLQEPQS